MSIYFDNYIEEVSQRVKTKPVMRYLMLMTYEKP